jgi:hypothetical protein
MGPEEEDPNQQKQKGERLAPILVQAAQKNMNESPFRCCCRKDFSFLELQREHEKICPMNFSFGSVWACNYCST